MNSQARLTGVIGSRLIGVDPYGLHSWSGISRFLFRECERQGILRRAIGAEVRQPLRSWLMARRFHPDRRVWRQHYYLDPAYRRALTAEVGRGLQAEDFEGGLLQIGAMFDLPALADGRCPCAVPKAGVVCRRSGPTRQWPTNAISITGSIESSP